MLAYPTTRVTVLRGTETDDYGDTVETGAEYLSGVPCSLIEKSQTVFDQSTSTPMEIRIITGRVPSGTDIREGDQLRDDTTEVIYSVVSYTEPSNPFRKMDRRLELKRVT